MMYMRGLFMLYPSMVNQVSFSTHHREQGEHTDYIPQEHLLDDLETLILDYFTVPLVRERDLGEVYRLVAKMKPLRELCVVSFHHERVENIHSLAQVGLTTFDVMRTAGLPFQWDNPNPACMLDRLTHPVFKGGESTQELMEKFPSRRYLLYEPQGSMRTQLESLPQAATYAMLLNRTLVVPPLVMGEISTKGKTLSFLNLSTSQTIAIENQTLVMINWHEFKRGYHGWIDRIVHYLPWTMRKKSPLALMNDDWLFERELIIASQAILYLDPPNSEAFTRSFGGCHDEILAFRHLIYGFAQFTDPVGAQQRASLQKSLPYSKWFKDLYHLLGKKWKAPSTCVLFSRGDNPVNCGKDLQTKAHPQHADKLLLFHSCFSTMQRSLTYGLEMAQKVGNFTTQTIYMMIEENLPPPSHPANTTLSTFGESPSLTKLPQVYWRKDIVQALREVPDLVGLTERAYNELAAILEVEFCGNAGLFVGNLYSSHSASIIARRKHTLLPSVIFGKEGV